jgi:cysteine desulfurase
MNISAYLDYAAATPLDPKVLEAMLPYLADNFYNPSSPYAPAINVRRDYEEAKQQLASIIGGKADEIIMTAGATESINLAFSAASHHVIVPATEHHAVLASAKKLDHTIVPVDKRGIVSVSVIKQAIRDDTDLISVATANNELGTIQPIREIAEIVKTERARRLELGNKTPIYLHSDASQGVGQLDISVGRLGVDMLTLNAGKIYGPKQVGLLWALGAVKLEPQIVGGGQERGLRSGTENVAGAIGFATALMMADKKRKSEVKRLSTLRDSMQERLLKAFPNAEVSGHINHRLAGHLHISFPDLDGERLLFLLETKNVFVATGSACAANKGTRSHVLEAIGLKPNITDGSIRITLGRSTNEETIEYATEALIEVISSEYARTKR